jgi:hypothetical protein
MICYRLKPRSCGLKEFTLVRYPLAFEINNYELKCPFLTFQLGILEIGKLKYTHRWGNFVRAW